MSHRSRYYMIRTYILIASAFAGIARAQTTIQPLPPAQPGPYGAVEPGYLQAAANDYPSISGSGPYSLPGPPDVSGQSQFQQPGPYSAQSVDAAIAQLNGPYEVLEAPIGSGASPMPQAESISPMPQPSPTSAEPIPAESIQLADTDGDGYQWYHYPWVWFPRDGWTSSIEFGLNGTDGNANSVSYAAGADIFRKTDIHNLTINLDYRRTSANGVETQDNARGNVDFDRAIARSAFATFIKSGVEYDQFKAFDARVNFDGGFSYTFAKTDDFTFITRFGAGAAKEVGSIDDAWKPEALFGLETSQQVNSRNRVFAKIDYFPAWEDFSDYRLVTDAGWEILLDNSENFSLKLSALNRYDSTPLGREPRDIDYAATLLYKF